MSMKVFRLHFLDVGAGSESLFAASQQNASDFCHRLRDRRPRRRFPLNTPNDNALSIFGRLSVMMPTAPLLSTMMCSKRAHDPTPRLTSHAMCPLAGVGFKWR